VRWSFLILIDRFVILEPAMVLRLPMIVSAVTPIHQGMRVGHSRRAWCQVSARLAIVGTGSPGAAVAVLPEPSPGLGAGGRLPGQEIVHGRGPPGQHREQRLALGLVQAVGVGEQAHPAGRVAARQRRPTIISASL
jgi:hypothetical protein